MAFRTSLLLLVLAALPASATSMMRMDVPALTRASDVVVRGTVVRKASRWTQSRRRIVTEVDISVAEAFKGSAQGGTVRVVQPGGEVGDIGPRMEGLASFTEGEEVVVFLERRGGDAFAVSGLAQGKYRVERSPDGRTARAVPEKAGHAELVDPVTQQRVSQATQPVPLEQLRQQVRESAGPAVKGAPVPGKTP